MIEVRNHTLDNGCRVLIRPTPGKPILATLAQVRWGGRDDTAEQAGLANLVSRLMTKGTETRSAYDIAETLESVGGGIDSGCDHDSLTLDTQVVENDWEIALDVLSDCLFHSTFPEDEFDKERALVCAGIRKSEDDKFALTYKNFRKTLYGSHPYGMPSEGVVETVERLEREAATALHRAVLKPENIQLTVVGNVPEAEFLKKIEKMWPERATDGATTPRTTPDADPAQGMGRTDELSREAEQGFIVAGYAAPPLGHADSTALRLACGVLGEGMSARLFSRLRDRDHLAYAVGSSLVARQLASHLIAFIGTGPLTVDAALEGLVRESTTLPQEPPDTEELERAREYILGKYLIARQTNGALAHTMGTAELLGLGWQWAEELPERMRAITRDDVVAAAEKYLKEPAVAVTRPKQA